MQTSLEGRSNTIRWEFSAILQLNGLACDETQCPDHVLVGQSTVSLGTRKLIL
jgi:hypothetical protein